MINFCRQHKYFAIFLSIFILIVSCGMSIQIQTCNAEGSKIISLYKIDTKSTCNDCCESNNGILKKSSCCSQILIAEYFKADALQTINTINLKHKIGQLFNVFFTNYSPHQFNKSTFKKVYYKKYIFKEIFFDLLLQKCVLII